MAQVAAVRQIQAHQTSTRSHNSLVDLQVGRAATETLDVHAPLGWVDVEGLESTLLAKQLDLVNVLVSTVVPGTGKTLGVLVGHWRAEGIEDGAGGNILRGNEDNGLSLTLDLLGLVGEEVRTRTRTRTSRL